MFRYYEWLQGKPPMEACEGHPGRYEYEGKWYCPEHRPPMPHRDAPTIGRCEWQRGHDGEAVWLIPRDGHFYCALHLQRILAIAWWKP